MTPRRRSGLWSAIALSTVVLGAVTGCVGAPSQGGAAAADCRRAASIPSRVPDQRLLDARDLPSAATWTERLAAAPPAARVRLPSTTISLSDFRPDDDGGLDGLDVRSNVHELIGGGPGRTIVQLRPHSSTKAADVPSSFPATNQLSVMRVNGEHVMVSDLTVCGTDQGHLYNGLRVSRAVQPTVSDVTIVGIPGSDNKPPGETFGLNDYRTIGARYQRLRIDGAGVGAAGFASNGSMGVTVTDSLFERNRWSMGATFYQVNGVSMSRCTSTDNGGYGFNFERVTGRVVLRNLVSRRNTKGDVNIGTDRPGAVFWIVDPAFDGSKLRVGLGKRYAGSSNLQKRSDIHVIVHGVERDDLIQFGSPY